MSDFRLPLSGDVTQAINPWSRFLRTAESQFGLINVNLGTSSDPEVEQEVLKRVGSYGKQLGRVGDVLRVVMQYLEKQTDITGDDKKKFIALEALLDEIDSIKEERRSEASLARKRAARAA